jgi:hypothetical protein
MRVAVDAGLRQEATPSTAENDKQPWARGMENLGKSKNNSLL